MKGCGGWATVMERNGPSAGVAGGNGRWTRLDGVVVGGEKSGYLQVRVMGRERWVNNGGRWMKAKSGNRDEDDNGGGRENV